MQELNDNEIAAVLDSDARDVVSMSTFGIAGLNSVTDHNLYSTCSVCGWCKTPEKCVASFQCPVCNAETGTLCKTPTGGLTGYHEERWERAGLSYR